MAPFFRRKKKATELEDLEENGILRDTVGHWMYTEYKKTGMRHMEALNKTLSSINGLTLSSVNRDELESLKRCLLREPRESKKKERREEEDL